MTPVVAGIGEVRGTGASAPSAHALTAGAALAALRDAGLRIEDVDGVVRFDRVAAWEYDFPGVLRVRRLDWYAALPVGAGSAPASVGMAAMAVAQGRASVVLGWHARQSIAGRAAGVPPHAHGPETLGDLHSTAAVVLRRWKYEHGVPDAALAVACRRAADRAPLPAGAGAFVVAAAERLEPGRRPRVPVLDWIQVALPNAGRDLVSWFAPRYQRALRRSAAAFWRRNRLDPGAVGVAFLHADPPPLVLPGLEAWGFAPPGRWPRRPRVNPSALSGGLDGIHDVLEAVRHLRGDASMSRRRPRLAFVAGSLLEPTSAVLLGSC